MPEATVGMVLGFVGVALAAGGTGLAGGRDQHGDPRARHRLLRGAFVFLARGSAKRERRGR